jgi:hypothetical protein
MLNVYKNQQNRQTGSRNLMGPKTLPMIWGTYMKLMTKYQIFFSATIDGRNLIFVHKLHIGTPYRGKRFWTHQIPTSCLPTVYFYIHWTYMFIWYGVYQISAINSCWEKCAYMFNVYKNQLSRQAGSRNLTGPKMLPTIWHTYMKLVTKYQIPVINSCLEKSYFLFADCWFLYTLNIYFVYSHSRIFLCNYWWPVGLLLPVCQSAGVSEFSSCFGGCNHKQTFIFFWS